MARTAWYLSLSRLWCVSLSLSSSGGTSPQPNGDVAGRSRDGLARRLLLRYGEVRVARRGELCGGFAPVAQRLFSGPGSGTFQVRSAISR